MKKWPSRQAYLAWYRKTHKKQAKQYRVVNRERINEVNMLRRRKRFDRMPREFWWVLLKDSEIQSARALRLKHKDPAAWKALVEKKRGEIKLSLIPDYCLDCPAFLPEVGRAPRQPELCKPCWGERYIKKQAQNKISLLYNPSRVV